MTDFGFWERVLDVEPEEFESIKGQVWLNESSHVRVSNAARLNHWGIIGRSGTGKSFGVGIIANQYPNVVLVDPGSGFRRTLKEMNEDRSWSFWKIAESGIRSKKQLRFNVRDLTVSSIEFMFADPRRARDFKNVRVELVEFASMRRDNPKKSFKGLKKLFRSYPKYWELIKDMSKVLHDEDAAPDIAFWQSGRHCIDVGELDSKTPALGLFLGAIVGDRRKTYRQREGLQPLLVAIDEMDTWANSSTPSGKAMNYVFAMGRKLVLHGMVIGTTVGRAGEKVKQNMAIKVFFRNDKEANAILKEHDVVLDAETFEEMGRKYITSPPGAGNCIVKAVDHGFEDQRPVHLTLFYQKLREKVALQGKGDSEAEINDFLDEDSVREALVGRI